MDHIGIDLHKNESQVCILTAHGELIEQRIRTRGDRFEALLDDRSPCMVLIEASTESEWVARCLEALGSDRGGPELRPHVRAADSQSEDRSSRRSSFG